jgi:tetratricopeptide (TPR) repeat protein
MKSVKAWTEQVIIPTYEIGEYEKNPIFLEKRVYQGSSGVVYPYPVIEKIYDEKVNKSWNAVFIENNYLKIMILPELGGRIQMAYDKIKQRHFVYYNQVIKPALVGLTGPWISGGIEFNWPQHHRPSTYEPVDYIIEENPDGSKTVWCSEIERMFRTKGMAGFTLYPDKAYLEIQVKLFNRTPVPQTFLWWANPAVKVNDHYQSVFPPDVHAVFDHGKRDVSSFPIATGTYYKVDYSSGVDISKYKNIPVPTSYMAIQSEYDFIGCYENDTKGGMLHVADHHISPGKKQWTWGNGDFGYAWDRNLTDEDGPYIELMCGVYTDNQPDFSWLMPNEEKIFKQYFMPYAQIGIVKNATKDAMINVDYNDRDIYTAIYATSEYKNATLEIWSQDTLITNYKFDISPSTPINKRFSLEKKIAPEQLEIKVKNENGDILVTWKPESAINKPIPEPAKPAKEPHNIPTNEQLYLTGLHLEQYRHATYAPKDYYAEALKRDKNDIRCNNAMGLLEMKKANFAQAETHFQTAINTLTEKNPNPYDGEAYYNLGLSLRFQYADKKAFNAFYKSIWNDAWQASGYFQLSQLATKNRNYEEALELIDKSLIRQYHNHKARHLKASLLRLKGRTEEALKLIEESVKIDRFSIGCYYEKYLVNNKEEDKKLLLQLMHGNIHHFTEIALDYYWSGLLNEAIDFLKLGIAQQEGTVYPLAWYFLGWFHFLNNNEPDAITCFTKGENEKPGVCFPNQLEAVMAFKVCISLLKNASKAYYYLGNFYYHNKEHLIAIENWEKSEQLNSGFPTVKRNLALAYFNKINNKELALTKMEEAFNLDTADSRVFMELDALYKKFNKDYQFRLVKLDENQKLVSARDDLYLEKISLLNYTHKFTQANQLLSQHKFHSWEGGEGNVTGQYILNLVEWAKEDILVGNYKEAITKLEKAQVYPNNLGEGKLYGAQENDIHFWIGLCYEKIKIFKDSIKYYTKASTGTKNPSPALFYNDQQPDKIFYQGMAFRKLNKKDKAEECFSILREYGEKHKNEKVKMDYFAVSLPDMMIWEDDLNIRNNEHCLYLIALSKIGDGLVDDAEKMLQSILTKNNYHQGAFIHLNLIKSNLLNSY